MFTCSLWGYNVFKNAIPPLLYGWMIQVKMGHIKNKQKIMYIMYVGLCK